TTFTMRNGRGIQVVAPLPTTSLEVRALSGEGLSRAEAINLMVAEESTRPFDLECGPLLRALLVEVSEHDHVLILCLHHAVSDGWSIDLLIAELFAHYRDAIENRAAELPPLSVQFRDYADWERQRMPEVLREQLPFWREQLSGELPVIQLPTDHPRPSVPRHH